MHLTPEPDAMSKIIAIANQKGGVGKTTTCVNLGASLAATRRRVLLVDLDAQGNATMGCGVEKNSLELSTCEALLGEVDIREAIVHVSAIGLDLLPANSDMTAAEVQLMASEGREWRLRQMLQHVQDDYDYIFIDCPPSLSMLTVNALAAADGVIIPMQCEYYALEGLSGLMETIESIRKTLNPRLEIEGLLRTMYDARNNLTSQVAAQLIMHFGDRVYNTVIPRNIRLAEAPSHGLPALLYDRQSRGAMAYLALAGEVLRRNQKEVVPEAAY
jgi:chromosome partitioning protein